MQQSLNLLPTVQQAIGNLLTTYEPEFLRFGYRLFVAFAVIILAWHGIRMMFSHDGLGEHMYDFAKLLLFVSFGYAFIAFYESPLPGKRTPQDRAAKHGATAGGENIFMGSAKPDDAFWAWFDSLGHHRNMVGDYAELGVGNFEKHWTQLFG